MSAGSAALTLPLNQTIYLPTSPKAGGGGDKFAGSIVLLAEELASLKDEVRMSRNVE